MTNMKCHGSKVYYRFMWCIYGYKRALGRVGRVACSLGLIKLSHHIALTKHENIKLNCDTFQSWFKEICVLVWQGKVHNESMLPKYVITHWPRNDSPSVSIESCRMVNKHSTGANVSCWGSTFATLMARCYPQAHLRVPSTAQWKQRV